MLMNTGAPRPIASAKGLLSTALYRMGAYQPTTYALEGAVASCATGFHWLQPSPLPSPLPSPSPYPSPSPSPSPSLPLPLPLTLTLTLTQPLPLPLSLPLPLPLPRHQLVPG